MDFVYKQGLFCTGFKAAQQKVKKNEKYLKLLLLVLIKLETGVAHPIKIMKQACKEKSEI